MNHKNKIKETPGRIAFVIINGIFLTALMIVCLYPLLYVVFASFSKPDQFIAHQGLLFKPLGLSLLSYQRAFSHPLIVSGYRNTLIVIVISLSLSMFLTCVGAYFLSRKKVLWQKPISFFIIFTMFFNGGLIPTYFAVKNFAVVLPWISNGTLTFKSFSIFNTLWALIIPGAINTYNLIVLRTGFAAIPDSIEEAAKIDGAGNMTILFRIILPLAKASIAVIVLYYGVERWNSWFDSSIYINDSNLYPLQLVLRQILLINSENSMTAGVDAGDQLAVSETIKYSVIIIATLPILCVYPFLQKYFVKGVMVGAVKG
mgnify:FL=1